MANLYKEFKHHGDQFKLAGKTAKYFIRALDAAAVEAYLKTRYSGDNAGQQYMDAVKNMLNTLGGQLAGRA